MKILHVVHGYPPSIGGSQLLVKNLSEQLVSRYQDEVTVFTTVAYDMAYFWGQKGPVMPTGIETMNGVTVHRFPVFNRLSFLRMLLAGVATRLRLPYNDWLRTIYNGPLIFDMTQAIAKSGAEVVFATAFPLLHMYYALTGARRAGIPIVFLGAIHTIDTWGYDRQIIYQAVQQADAYIALTTFERDYLVKYGINPNKITIVGGGVNINTYLNADGAAAREKYYLGNGPIIAAIGKQNARKRFDMLLDAMPKVWIEFPDARLLIAGARGSHSDHICDLINRLPASWQGQVTVLTDFPESDKPSLLAASDLLVLPSAMESFGIAFAEAWACKKPVIGARVGVISSVINDGLDGLLFTYEDPESLAQAILYLLGHPQERAKMGNAGLKKVMENYTWEIVADRIRDVYTKVINLKNDFD